MCKETFSSIQPHPDTFSSQRMPLSSRTGRDCEKFMKYGEKIISKYCECLNIKELTFCFTKFFITISVPATFPVAWAHLKNALFSRSCWDDFYQRHRSWLFCLLTVPVEPQCVCGLGACKWEILLAVVWFFPFAASHLLLKCNVQRGYYTQQFGIYYIKWPWDHTDCIILFSLNSYFTLYSLYVMELYTVLQVCLFSFLCTGWLLW